MELLENFTSDWRLAGAAMIAAAILAKHLLKFIKGHDELYALVGRIGMVVLLFVSVPAMILVFVLIIRALQAVMTQ